GVNVWQHVLPRHHDQDIKIEPPEKQEGKIELPNAGCVIVARNVWAQRKRCHHGSDMKKEYRVPCAQVWHLAMHYHFGISPVKLISQPQERPKRSEQPEKTNSSLRT